MVRGREAHEAAAVPQQVEGWWGERLGRVAGDKAHEEKLVVRVLVLPDEVERLGHLSNQQVEVEDDNEHLPQSRNELVRLEGERS